MSHELRLKCLELAKESLQGTLPRTDEILTRAQEFFDFVSPRNKIPDEIVKKPCQEIPSPWPLKKKDVEPYPWTNNPRVVWNEANPYGYAKGIVE